MIRAVKNFEVGDFIRVEDRFGRVSERGLFHVEIQSEERELITLPNLYLVTHPVTTIRSSGTMIAAELTLGYDVPRGQAEELLLAAAGDAALKDAFVQILDLGDFSVKYRVAGLLEEVKYLVSARSLLRGKILDRFHDAGVEIVSPNFMNTRAIPEDRSVIPAANPITPEADSAPPPEELIFDKAEEAEKAETQAELALLRGREAELEETILSREKALQGKGEPGG